MQFWEAVTAHYLPGTSDVSVIPDYCFWPKYLKIDQKRCLNVDGSKMDKTNIFLPCTEFGIVCSRRIKPSAKSSADDLK